MTLEKRQRQIRNALIVGLFEVYIENGRRITQQQISDAVAARLGIPLDARRVSIVLRNAGHETGTERWWRPETLEEKLGKEQLTEALRSAIANQEPLEDLGKRIGASRAALRRYALRYGIVQAGERIRDRGVA